jgi:hypothetical protein
VARSSRTLRHLDAPIEDAAVAELAPSEEAPIAA